MDDLPSHSSRLCENCRKPGVLAARRDTQEAAALLHSNLKHPSHEFWADEISFVDAVASFQKELFGHRQVTDAYLLGLVMHKKAGDP
jgi:hypothetical protein